MATTSPLLLRQLEKAIDEVIHSELGIPSQVQEPSPSYGANLYFNTLQTPQPSPTASSTAAAAASITFRELFSPSFSRRKPPNSEEDKICNVLMLSFTLDPDILAPLQAAAVPTTVVVDPRVAEDLPQRPGTGGRFIPGLSHIAVFAASMQRNIPYATFHPKLIAIQFQSKIRIVISSSNLGVADWSMLLQSVWVQDFFPLHSPSANLRRRLMPRPPTCIGDFEAVLEQFLRATGLPQRHYHWLFDGVDYGSAQVDLLPSVQGYHRGSDCQAYGIGRLAAIRRHHMQALSQIGSTKQVWSPETAKSVVQSVVQAPALHAITSSIGRLSSKFAVTLLLSSLGTCITGSEKQRWQTLTAALGDMLQGGSDRQGTAPPSVQAFFTPSSAATATEPQQGGNENQPRKRQRVVPKPNVISLIDSSDSDSESNHAHDNTGGDTRRTSSSSSLAPATPPPLLAIYWPTHEYIRRSALGWEGTGQMFLSKSSWEAPSFPRKLIRILRYSRPGPTQFFHAKLLFPDSTFSAAVCGALGLRFNASARPQPGRARPGNAGSAKEGEEKEGEGTEPWCCTRDWLYSGSANVSAAAWGSVSSTRGKETLFIRNFELGVVFPPVAHSPGPVHSGPSEYFPPLPLDGNGFGVGTEEASSSSGSDSDLWVRWRVLHAYRRFGPRIPVVTDHGSDFIAAHGQHPFLHDALPTSVG